MGGPPGTQAWSCQGSSQDGQSFWKGSWILQGHQGGEAKEGQEGKEAKEGCQEACCQEGCQKACQETSCQEGCTQEEVNIQNICINRKSKSPNRPFSGPTISSYEIINFLYRNTLNNKYTSDIKK